MITPRSTHVHFLLRFLVRSWNTLQKSPPPRQFFLQYVGLCTYTPLTGLFDSLFPWYSCNSYDVAVLGSPWTARQSYASLKNVNPVGCTFVAAVAADFLEKFKKRHFLLEFISLCFDSLVLIYILPSNTTNVTVSPCISIH